MTLKALTQTLSIFAPQQPMPFKLPSGKAVPAHYHVTEVGSINKKYIDCGGTLREESSVTFQLWYTTDVDHRLSAGKLLNIINMAQETLSLPKNAPIEIEYQQMDAATDAAGGTIGKYALHFEKGTFYLQNTLTDCLAKDACGLTPPTDNTASNACNPASGCC